jgi:hypothetical protein
MATSSKQYKAIGEDLWKGRTDKIVRLTRHWLHLIVDNLPNLGHDRMQSCSR